MVVETRFLEQIDDFELVDDGGQRALYLKVKPLRVALSVQVGFQNEFVLKLSTTTKYGKGYHNAIHTCTVYMLTLDKMLYMYL